MRFENVGLLSIGYLLPPLVLTSEQIEEELAPVYTRLKLPEGRLRLMSGIGERRLWGRGTRISDKSAESCRLAMQAAGVAPSEVDCLIHASVCREYLEPATACRVHHLCQLPSRSWVYDVSNACLGMLNGAIQIAQGIELGLYRAGLVVGTEDSRGLKEATIASLLSDATLTRQSIKPAFASLTIGSGSCAWLLVDRRRFPEASPLVAAVVQANTQYHGLCESDQDQAGDKMQPIMNTDSEQLLHAGVATGVAAFDSLLAESCWTRDHFERTVCHQVGAAHRKLMLESLSLSPDRDFSVFEFLGNTGSVALPTALGIGLHRGVLGHGEKTGLLGIGSGINSVMISATLSGTKVEGIDLAEEGSQ